MRFEFYIPSVSALDILKGILLFVDKQKTYTSNPVKYNRFFQEVSKEYKDLFRDISFEEDTFLPYSMDLEKAYTAAMEFNILKRPNPDIYPCEIMASEKRLRKDAETRFNDQEMTSLRDIAKRFQEQLKEP
jgi:hypothetical protein